MSQSLQKAIEAAERAEKASQTPAPAEIYPATEEKLGGVKVDGQTITASEDGTISASTVIMKTSDLSVQVAHPNNFLIYDNGSFDSFLCLKMSSIINLLCGYFIWQRIKTNIIAYRESIL